MNPEGGNKMNIGAKIIEIRKQRDMTQEDFAKIFHVTMLMCHKVTQIREQTATPLFRKIFCG